MRSTKKDLIETLDAVHDGLKTVERINQLIASIDVNMTVKKSFSPSSYRSTRAVYRSIAIDLGLLRMTQTFPPYTDFSEDKIERTKVIIIEALSDIRHRSMSSMIQLTGHPFLTGRVVSSS